MAASPPPSDGRSAAWAPDTLVTDIWETFAELPLTGPQVARVRLALDSLAEADTLASPADSMSDRDALAAAAGARAARRVVSDLLVAIAEPKPEPPKVGRPRKAPAERHSRRRYADEDD
jgi:hypothetical protein